MRYSVTEIAFASAQGREGARGSSEAPLPAGDVIAEEEAGAESAEAEEASELLPDAPLAAPLAAPRLAPSSVAGKMTVWNGTLSLPMNCTTSTSVPSRGLHHASHPVVSVAVIETYPTGASNQTYRTFSSNPARGTRVPQRRSRDMHLGRRPSRIHAAVVVAQLAVQPPPLAQAAW